MHIHAHHIVYSHTHARTHTHTHTQHIEANIEKNAALWAQPSAAGDSGAAVPVHAGVCVHVCATHAFPKNKIIIMTATSFLF